MTPSRPIGMRQGGREALKGSPPCFLLVGWEPYMIASRMASHFLITIRIMARSDTRKTNDAIGGILTKNRSSMSI
jgi:hypothetical protein